ncbi:MAG: alpha/beta hydrolase [Burkholderiales bacterium]|nr:alpha/beta hydrolase [Burkholderiales bacterium]
MRAALASLAFVWLGMLMAAHAASPEIRSTRFATSDGVSLHMLEALPPDTDERHPVVALIPGWSMPASVWRAQLSALGATYHVVALDPRGQGESDVPASGFTIDRRADDIAEFVTRYRRVVLIGWSLGALEALHYVHRHGDHGIEALVLVDSSVGEEPVPPPGKSFIEALRRDRAAAIDEFVRDTFRTPRSEEEVARLREAALRMPLDASLSLFPSGIRRERWRDIARAFTKPLLYVVTSQFAEQAANLQRNRPATRIEVFEDAGHALFVDESARFNRVIEEFITQARHPKIFQ